MAAAPPQVPDPLQTCPVCQRNRRACTEYGSYACQVHLLRGAEMPGETIVRLVNYVVDWRMLARDLAAEVAELRTPTAARCGWCGIEFTGSSARSLVQSHVGVCPTNPLVQRIAKAREALLSARYDTQPEAISAALAALE